MVGKPYDLQSIITSQPRSYSLEIAMQFAGVAVSIEFMKGMSLDRVAEELTKAAKELKRTAKRIESKDLIPYTSEDYTMAHCLEKAEELRKDPRYSRVVIKRKRPENGRQFGRIYVELAQKHAPVENQSPADRKYEIDEEIARLQEEVDQLSKERTSSRESWTTRIKPVLARIAALNQEYSAIQGEQLDETEGMTPGR